MQQDHIDYLELVRGQIDISKVPFSDRGSRLVVQQAPGESSLRIRLGERLTVLDPDPEAFFSRPPFIEGLHFVDGTGKALEFDAHGSPDLIRFSTSLGDFKLAFQDEQTIGFGLPDGVSAGLRLNLNIDHFRPGGPGSQSLPVRSLVYAANGVALQERAQPHFEYILQGGKDRTILLRIGADPVKPVDVQPFSLIQREATARWRAWFERAPQVGDEYAVKYAYAWWVMGNNLISPRGCIRAEAMAPSKGFYIGLWLWDSAMHALAYRHTDPALARDQIRAFLALQQTDGMLPDAIFDEGAVFELDHPIRGKVTKPPILAWAALKIHEVAPDPDFLREIYPGLVRLNHWWFEQNDDDGDGVVQYSHPYSSGLDDSPLWDHGLPVESPDINTYLYLSMESLSRMAELLGLDSDAGKWKQRASVLLLRMIEDLWDEEAGLFRALVNEMPVPVVTPVNLLPLWTGALPAHLTSALIANLTDPRKFWGGTMLPTVARDDPVFDPDTMWRGPVWANINYFFIEALNRVHRPDLAKTLRDSTINMIMSQPSIYEYYNPVSGEPPARSVPTFGWTAAIFIELAIQASLEDTRVPEIGV